MYLQLQEKHHESNYPVNSPNLHRVYAVNDFSGDVVYLLQCKSHIGCLAPTEFGLPTYIFDEGLTKRNYLSDYRWFFSHEVQKIIYLDNQSAVSLLRKDDS